MKVQYFGDVNDYRKFALLRLLARPGNFKIGVCWMLTDGDGRADGNNRGYIRQPHKWRSFDPELFDALKAVPSIPTLHDLERVEHKGLIAGASFLNDLTLDARAARQTYHHACLSAFLGRNLAFFDPDNGLDVRSCLKGRKNSSKYVYIDELTDHFDAGRSVLFYQHYPREPRTAFLAKIATRLSTELHSAAIWSFQTPYVAFVLAARPEHDQKVEVAVNVVRDCWPDAFFKTQRHT